MKQLNPEIPICYKCSLLLLIANGLKGQASYSCRKLNMYALVAMAIYMFFNAYICFITHLLFDMKVFLYYFWDKIVDCKNMVEGNEAKFEKNSYICIPYKCCIELV